MSASDRSKKIVDGVDVPCLAWLNEKECSGDFETLVSQHCEPAKMWGYMTAINLATQHHAELAKNRSDIGGFDGETFDGFVTRARRVAKELERLYSSDLGSKAIHQAAGVGGIAEFRNIPRQLRLVVAEAQKIYEKTSHRKKPLFDEAVADLSAYVMKTTGTWHDKEVVALIDAVTGREAHSADDQRAWRNDHAEFMNRASRRVNEFLSPGR
jgi:hypothetical protein